MYSEPSTVSDRGKIEKLLKPSYIDDFLQCLALISEYGTWVLTIKVCHLFNLYI